MNWTDHQRWAARFGIDATAAQYVNRIVDIEDEGQLPEAYKQAVADSADQIAATRGATRGNSALSRVITEETLRHDAGRRKTTRGTLAAEWIISHLSQKGEDFVASWYLHHHLDYLSEQRTSGDRFHHEIDRYPEEYPEAHNEQIEKFIREHANTLRAELGYTESP